MNETISIVNAEPNVQHRIKLSPIRLTDKISTNKRSVISSEPSAKHHIKLSAMRVDYKNQHNHCQSKNEFSAEHHIELSVN